MRGGAALQKEEAMTLERFSAPGNLQDLSPALAQGWSDIINYRINQDIRTLTGGDPAKSLWQKMTAVLHERLDLALEILALSLRLAVLERAAKRPQFSQADRCVWVLLSTAWAQWRDAFAS
jgi:hypothetical protein